MRRLPLFCALLLAQGLALATGLLPLESLYGAMDKDLLEDQIAAVEALGDPSGDAERLKRLGIAWHNLAVLNVSGASDQAEHWLDAASRAAPGDMEVLAYLGSARTLVARDSWNVVTKVSRVNMGANLLDKAVRKAPENVVVRLVRANNSLALPRFFRRRSRALEDLTFLHDRGDALGLDPATAAEVAFKLGQIQLEDGNGDRARTLFEEAIRHAPKSTWARQAAGHL